MSTEPEEIELLAELAAAGYVVDSLAELRDSPVRYRKAVPVLLAGLGRAVDPKVKDEIVRALTVPWAKKAATRPLIEQFRSVQDETGLGLRWTIGSALDVLWDDACFEELVGLATQQRFGRAREMVVLGLGRSKRAEAVEVLIELLDDPVVNGHAVSALRKLRVPAARAGLERMLDDDRAWVRKEARLALAALD